MTRTAANHAAPEPSTHAAAPDALPNPVPRADWLALDQEAVLEAELPVVDAHHHLWDTPHPRYLFDEILADVSCGHNVRATVFVEAGSMWRRSGPSALQAVGEVEFANGVAAMSESGKYGDACINAAIVGHADLRAGAELEGTLEALIAAGNGRLRGIRHSAAHDPDVRMLAPAGMLRDPAFRAGFAMLQRKSLRFDLWLYHPQLGDAIELMRAFPEARVVLNHIGGRIGVGRFAPGRAGESAADAQWRADLRELAAFPNFHVKLSGLGMALAGFQLHTGVTPPSSDQLVELWSPRLMPCIELFGADRCMFASNFPVDKASCSYTALWNAFKKMTAQASVDERAALFAGTAARFYSIDLRQ